MSGASGVIDAGVMRGVRKVNNLIDSTLSAGQENPIMAWQDMIRDDATGEYLGTIDKNAEYYYDSVASSERCTKYLQDIEDGKLPFEVKKKLTADEANDVWYEDHDYSDPPYSKNYIVFDMVLQEDKKFVRVFDEEKNKRGSWIMLEEDVKGLTPKQIQSKYSLSFVPTKICNVHIKAGTRIRVGVTSSLYGMIGHGLQFDLNQQSIGIFNNTRSIDAWSNKNK